MQQIKKSLIFVFPLTVFVFPVITFATVTGGGPCTTKICNPTSAGSDLMSLITTVMTNIVMPIAAVAVVMWIIWAGFSFVIAQGKPAEIEKAKKRLLWSLIGGGILLGAAGIATVVKTTFQSLL